MIYYILILTFQDMPLDGFRQERYERAVTYSNLIEEGIHIDASHNGA